MKKHKFLFFTLVYLMISPLIFSQGTTGAVRGKIIEEGGEVLPGVTVSIAGTALMGTRSVVTDTNGDFRIVNLPPGNYKIVAELKGFKKTTLENIAVTLESTQNLEIRMAIGAIEEEVTVTAGSPVVDTSSSKLTTNVRKEFFDALPKGRNYQDMVYLAPGVQSDSMGVSVSGGQGSENQFIVDGTNITGPYYGTDQITNIVYEFVEEVQMKTGGYEAEFGGALGGVVNVITKSGGNVYHGEMRLNYQSNQLYADPKIGIYGEGALREFNYYDISASLGGYLVKDKLWFFGAYSPSFRTSFYAPVSKLTGETGRFKQKDQINTYSAKLTFLPHPNHTLTISAFGDPGTKDGYNPGSTRDWNSPWQASYSMGSTNVTMKYDGILSQTWLAHFLIGRYYTNPIDKPVSGDPSKTYRQGYLGFPDRYITGGYGAYNRKNYGGRWTANGDMTLFWGNHTIKGGAQYVTTQSEQIRSGLRYYYYPRFDYYYVRDYSTKGTQHTDIFGLFLQDTWKVGKRLVLNLGIRFEDQKIHAGSPSKFYQSDQVMLHFKFNQQFSPRVGISYDLFGNGKSKLFGSYGKFFEMVPLTINIRQYGYETDIYYYYRLSTGQLYLTTQSAGEPEKRPGSVPGEDPNVYPPYTEEFILGFETEFMKDFSLSVRGVHKRLGDLFEDGSFDFGNSYYRFNPGIHFKGDWNTNPVGFPAAKRNYWALEFLLTKRFADNYQFSLSYSYSRLRGNTGGISSQPNIASDWDFPEGSYNAYGILPNDTPHQFKFDGIYIFPFGLSLGATFRARSGRPYTAAGESVFWAPVYLDPQGTTGRTPFWTQLDLHVEYSLVLGGKYRIGLYADAFNVYNTKATEAIDSLYTANKLFGLGDPQAFPPPYPKDPQSDNPNYGKTTRYQQPFRALLGVRFSF